jgi:nucleotide-binding universal stress UspA family protein
LEVARSWEDAVGEEVAVETDQGRARAVVVGVDGSEPSLRAVDWAAAEAAARGLPLAVCCVAVAGTDKQPMLWDGQEGVLLPADDVLRRAVRRAAATADVTVSGEVMRGDPAQQLLGRAGEADLLVVGARGLGAFVGMLVGSVSEHVAGLAACPVVVVHDAGSPDLPVLVGVDGSPANHAAVAFAFDAAARRRVELVALSAAEPQWIRPALGSPAPPAADAAGAQDAARNRLDEALRPWTDRYPDVRVRRVAVVGGAARALIAASSRAGMAVVGSRGHGTLSGLVLGSVSRHLLRHAKCPVAVVPG